MDEQELNNLIEKMRSWGIIFDDGLSASEVARIEAENSFRFPEDLKALLMKAMPVWEPDYEKERLCVEERFPNWRTHASIVMRLSRNFLYTGIRNTIEYGYEMNDAARCWLKDWGPLPDQLSDALAIFDVKFAAAPVLIPIYSHRFIPTEPRAAGNPIFSIAGTDIVYYGRNLVDYFYQEFARTEEHPENFEKSLRGIEFWDDFIYRPPFQYPRPPQISMKDVDLDKYLTSSDD